MKAHPDKFMGVCRVDPQNPGAAAELERWTRAGYHGVRLSPYTGPASDWIADRAQMDAIWGKAAELRVPICILCDTARLPDVDRVVERFADRVDVCIDHMADCPIDRPGELDKLLALARYPRVFVKLSHLWLLSREPYPYRDTHTQVRRLYDAFGPQRLMWGTDWPAVEPYCGYGRALAAHKKFGATAMVFFPPSVVPPSEEAESLRNSFQFMNELGRLAMEEYGVRMGLHNHTDSGIENQKQVDRFLDGTDPRHVFCAWDTAHLLLGGCDVLATFQKSADRIVYTDFAASGKRVASARAHNTARTRRSYDSARCSCS